MPFILVFQLLVVKKIIVLNIFPLFNFEPPGYEPLKPGTFVCINLDLHLIVMMHITNCNISISGSCKEHFFLNLLNFPLPGLSPGRINFICTNLNLSFQTLSLPGSIWWNSFAEEDYNVKSKQMADAT